MSNLELIRLKKDSSRANQLDCVISYFFQLHLMLHASVRTFDVTGTLEIFLGTKQGMYNMMCKVNLGYKCIASNCVPQIWLS